MKQGFHQAFVVGTGRCGSTLVSNMLNLHKEVLSLSEFFAFITDLGTLIPEAFPNKESKCSSILVNY